MRPFRNKTGGGVGSNQYQVRGRSVAHDASGAPQVDLMAQMAPQGRPAATTSQRAEAMSLSAARACASNPNTGGEMLSALSHRPPYPEMPLRVATNPNCPPEVLAQLSTNCEAVRCAVADHPNAPEKILKQWTWAEEPLRWLSESNLRRREDPARWLELLAAEREIPWQLRPRTQTGPNANLRSIYCWQVLHAAPAEMEPLVRQHADDDDLLRYMGRSGKYNRLVAIHASPAVMSETWDTSEGFRHDDAVRWHLAGRIDSTPEMLHDIGTDPNSAVRYRVSLNPNCDEDTIRLLAVDPDEIVRKSARARLPPHLRALANLAD